MSKPRKNVNSYIKEKTPKNVSGSIKKALDLIENLKKSQGNPKMEDAVGAGALANMLAQVAQDFAGTDQSCSELAQQLAVLRAHLNDTIAIVPQTNELQTSAQDMQKAIDALLKQMRDKNCPMPSANNNNTLT